MEVRTRAHWLPKAGHTADEYEDAFWPDNSHRLHVQGFRCAIADGATETSFSDLWARMLAYEWGRGYLDSRRFSASLGALQAAWCDHVNGKPLPWYAEEKLRSGAFSSLLGLTLSDGRGARRWHALAVGDSCLFHVRGAELIAAFPLTDADQFNSRPLLLSSKPRSNGQATGAMQSYAGSWRPGDTFLLMTDALACWFLRDVLDSNGVCASPELFGHLVGGRGKEAFEYLIPELRRTGRLRNDDVTLLEVEVA